MAASVSHEKAKKFINRVGMGLTCILLIYGLIQLSNFWVTQAFMVVFGIYLEVEVQYIWGLSFTYAKNKHWIKALLLRLACSGYVIIGICFAVGFFAMEIGHKEQEVQTIRQAQTNYQTKIDEYNNMIKYYQAQANNETDKRGPKAMEIENNIKMYQTKRDELENSPKSLETSDNDTKTSGNVFKYAEEVFKPLFGVTENFLKFLIVGYAFFMIYLGVMLTYWKIKMDKDEADEDEDEDEDKDERKTESASEELVAVDKTELLSYIKAAIRDTGTLNGNERVAEQTGIPLDKCDKFKNWLIGQGLIKKTQGASVAVLPKKAILERMAEFSG